MTTMTPPTRRARKLAAPAQPLERAYNWRDDAACKDLDDKEKDLFFPVAHTNGWKKQTKAAKAICAACPVQPACLDWALDTGQPTGVWGGMSERQRRALRGDQQSQTQRCLDNQAWIEAQVKAGMTQQEIARRLRVDKTTLSRALARFRAERENTQEVQAA